jgi:hypothetical protein
VYSEKIKNSFTRNEKALSMNPEAGKGTKTTRARIREGLTCDIEEGDWKMIADMEKTFGGDGQGPPPGVFGRAALSSCLAIGYATWADLGGHDRKIYHQTVRRVQPHG